MTISTKPAVLNDDSPGDSGRHKISRFVSRTLRKHQALTHHLPTALFFVLAGAILFWVTWDALRVRLITYHQGSDYWEHTATFRALLDDPWHPKNPQVVSPASSPRFGPHFVLYALISRALGLDAIGAMGVAAILNTLAFLGGIYAFFRSYFRSRWAPLLGLVILFSSWWEGWHFSNVYQLKIYFSVAGYPSTAALGTTLLTFALAISELRVKKERPAILILLTLLWAAIFITHPLTAMMAIVGGLALAATQPRVPLRQRLLVGGTVLAGCLVSEGWPYFSAWHVVLGGAGSDANWIGQSLDLVKKGEPAGAKHYFYRPLDLLRTLGLAAVGVPLSLYLLIRRRHWFIPLGAGAMATPFVVNLWFAVGLGHRFILLAIFFLQVALVWLLLKCAPPGPLHTMRPLRWGLRWFATLSAFGVVAYFAWVNVDKAMNRFEAGLRRAQAGESVYVRYARRVRELAGESAVVLADERTAWPIPTFGTKIVSLLHGNPLVPDDVERTVAVRQFLQRNLSDAKRHAIIERFGVTHVVVRRSNRTRAAKYLAKYGVRHNLPGGYVLYALRR